ncbi:MAG: peptide chain release factor 2 [Clostridia bacterium]|nr:peptide chain release factor 2 [Clostridia bacterium]
MQEFDESRVKVKELKAILYKAGESLDLAKLRAELDGLKEEQAKDGFWNDLQNAQEVNKKVSALENKIERYEKLEKRLDEVELLIQLCDEEGALDELDGIGSELGALDKEIDVLRIETLLKGKYDNLNAILTLHAGAGGTEAQDWTQMLYRMYTMYAERHGFKLKVLDYLDGDEAGIKSVSFMVEGENAYGYLKAEKGVHRLVRISPFDSNSRRHTSFASLEVAPEIIVDNEVQIRQEDLKVDTYRSSGAGGQHVNKTESAVRITHIPTGIIVQCQNERSQIQNREVCMRMLTSKLVEMKEREQMEQAQEIKGELKKIEWGSQIRSYVFQPYTMVKDHRTGCETGNVSAVMDGELDEFITQYLSKS